MLREKKWKEKDTSREISGKYKLEPSEMGNSESERPKKTPDVWLQGNQVRQRP